MACVPFTFDYGAWLSGAFEHLGGTVPEETSALQLALSGSLDSYFPDKYQSDTYLQMILPSGKNWTITQLSFYTSHTLSMEIEIINTLTQEVNFTVSI